MGSFVDTTQEDRERAAGALIPWDLIPQHRLDYVATMLREEGLRRADLDSDTVFRRALDNWLKYLDAKKLVITYTSKGGFQYVPRQDSDTDIIRAG
jgi:hypothetical protein